MKKQFNREEEFLRKVLNEAVIEKPSADFKSKIMRHIEANKVPVKSYEPLISERVSYIVAITVVLAAGGLYIQFSDTIINFSGNSDYLKLEIPEINFPKIYLSRPMQYAFAFVALFFLQVPFLKKIIDRQYEVKIGEP